MLLGLALLALFLVLVFWAVTEDDPDDNDYDPFDDGLTAA